MSISYVLIRSDRRTLSLVINREGDLTVRAPRRMSLKEIEGFIAQKGQWILQKQRLATQRQNQRTGLCPEEGKDFPFQDGSLTLRRAQVPFAFAYDGALLLPQGQALLPALGAWLKGQAEQRLLPRVRFWEERTGLRVSSARFSTPRTRWGSMSAKKELRLNVALMLCPEAVADYVIVHELAHIRHMNHSPAFWRQVEQWMPEASSRRAWLKENNHLITFLHPPRQ